MKKLFIGSLPWSVRNEELADFFSKVGTVASAAVIIDRETRRSKGFGFVEFENDEEADRAIAELNGADMNGRNIIVSEARPLEKRD